MTKPGEFWQKINESYGDKKPWEKDLTDSTPVVFDLAIQETKKSDIIYVPGVNDGELIPGVSETAHTIDLGVFRRKGDVVTKQERKKEAVIALSPNPEKTRQALEIAEAGFSTKKRHQIDIVKVVELSLKGVKDKDIAVAIGLQAKPSTINFVRVLRKEYLPSNVDIQEIKAFDHVKNLLLSKKQKQVLEAITEEKLERASVKDLAVIFETVFDKQRLLTGQSTENVSMKFSGIVEDIFRRRAQNAVQSNTDRGSDTNNAG